MKKTLKDNVEILERTKELSIESERDLKLIDDTIKTLSKLRDEVEDIDINGTATDRLKLEEIRRSTLAIKNANVKLLDKSKLILEEILDLKKMLEARDNENKLDLNDIEIVDSPGGLH